MGMKVANYPEKQLLGGSEIAWSCVAWGLLGWGLEDDCSAFVMHELHNITQPCVRTISLPTQAEIIYVIDTSLSIRTSFAPVTSFLNSVPIQNH